MRLAAGAPSHTAHARSGPQSRHGARPQPREQGARLKAWAGASDAETGTRTAAHRLRHAHAGSHTGAHTRRDTHGGSHTPTRTRGDTHAGTPTPAHTRGHEHAGTQARTCRLAHTGTHTQHAHMRAHTQGTHMRGRTHVGTHTHAGTHQARTHQAAPTGTHTLSCMGYQPPSDSLQLGPSAPSSAFKPTALHKSGMKQSTTLSEPEQVCSRGRFCG